MRCHDRQADHCSGRAPDEVEVARTCAGDASSEAEPARQFLQGRVRLWARWVFLLSFGFYLTNIVVWLLGRRTTTGLDARLLHPSALDHLAASLVFGTLWVVTRRAQLTATRLRVLELGALLAGCALFALMGASLTWLTVLSGLDVTFGPYAGLLACANVVAGRAIMVPSTARRTVVASAAAMAPLVPATLAATGAWVVAVQVGTWCAVSVAIAVVGSRVIYGLRAEAARGQRLGRYTLERLIGAGGMGVVYKASHVMLRRPTAIKLLPLDRAGEASLIRFEREVQMTAQLSHPNTVAVYDYGRTPDGVFYYAMEYLDGINLEDLVREDGPQPPGRVVAILDQVCGALAEAHGMGLVHRDIKPANIILTERGGEPDVAKVVDFGLVKPLAADEPPVLSAGRGLTGTPLYMSPEEMLAPGSGDARSDLYALGAVAYWLLAGHPVFEAVRVADIRDHHLRTDPVPPSVRRGSPLPADLERLVLQCLRKAPAERPGSAHAVRALLGRCHVPPWTTADAARWWAEFRATRASGSWRVPHVTDPALDLASQVTRVSTDAAGRREPTAQDWPVTRAS